MYGLLHPNTHNRFFQFAIEMENAVFITQHCTCIKSSSAEALLKRKRHSRFAVSFFSQLPTLTKQMTVRLLTKLPFFSLVKGTTVLISRDQRAPKEFKAKDEDFLPVDGCEGKQKQNNKSCISASSDRNHRH